MSRLGMYVAAGAALAAPCSAFVPQGNLRSQAPALAQAQGTTAPMPTGSSATSVFAAAGVAALGVAAAGASRKQQPRAVERRVVGVTWPVNEKFDPLNLGSTDAKMERYTAVEIKHGRVAMIATVGYLLPDVFRFPGCEGFGNGLSALNTIPLEGWIQLVAFVGAHEVLVKPRQGGMGSFDLGLGTELLEGIPAEELERRQTVERNNGRLAMVAIIGMMWQDGTFGKTPLAMFAEDGFWGPDVNFIIKDIPICSGTALCAMDKTSEMSPSVPFLKYPMPLKGWVGDEKAFDPLGVSDALPVYYLREAELKHGRVCMLATLGWIATDVGVRFPGDQFQNVSTVEAHDKMVSLGLMQPFLATIFVMEAYSGWLIMQGLDGSIKRDAGDYFFGKKFLPQEPAKERDMRLKELENGRLAMVAFSGICTQAVLFKSTWPFM
jgi:hypothetical protein